MLGLDHAREKRLGGVGRLSDVPVPVRGRPDRTGRARGAALAIALTPLLLAVGKGDAQVHLTQQEALRLAFPQPATIERRSAFLDDEQLERARAIAGQDVEVRQSVVTHYIGREDGEPLGVAYFDSHRVRTLPEVLMIVVTPDGRVERIEVLAFSEPPEYEPPEGWLEMFEGRELEGDLDSKRPVVNMTGATLTSRAVTDAVRRVLALHQVIHPFESDDAASGAGP